MESARSAGSAKDTPKKLWKCWKCCTHNYLPLVLILSLNRAHTNGLHCLIVQLHPNMEHLVGQRNWSPHLPERQLVLGISTAKFRTRSSFREMKSNCIIHNYYCYIFYYLSTIISLLLALTTYSPPHLPIKCVCVSLDSFIRFNQTHCLSEFISLFLGASSNR